EDRRDERAPQGLDSPQRATRLAEFRRLHEVRDYRPARVGPSAYRILETSSHEGHGDDRDEQDEERGLPADELSDETRERRADERGDVHGVAVVRERRWSRVGRVVVRQQRVVNGT